MSDQQPPVKPAAPVWFIAENAIRQYFALMRAAGFPAGDPASTLQAMAANCIEAERLRTRIPKREDFDLFTYRGPRPYRFILTVSTRPHPSGLPQLVDVASGGGRTRAYHDNQRAHRRDRGRR